MVSKDQFTKNVNISQAGFHERRRNPFTTFSQYGRVKIIEEYMYKHVVALLRETGVFSDEEINTILTSHPPAHIYTGLLIDERIVTDNPDIKIFLAGESSRYADPEAATELAGMKLLEEILVDTLAKSKGYPKWLELIYSVGYERSLQTLSLMLKTDTLDPFLRAGWRYLLLGGEAEKRKLEATLLYEDLRSTAQLLGRYHYYGEGITQKSAASETSSLRARLLYALNTAGNVKSTYPGIIGINLASEYISVLMNIFFLMMFMIPKVEDSKVVLPTTIVMLLAICVYEYAVIAGLRRAVTHEYIHYLSQNLNRYGLMQTQVEVEG